MPGKGPGANAVPEQSPALSRRCCTETSRPHPDCWGHSPSADPQGKALGLTLQAIPWPAATRPLPNTTGLPWLLQRGAGQALPPPTTESWTCALGHSCPSAPYSLGWDGLGTSVGSSTELAQAAVVGILPEKTADWREADQTPPLDCSGLNEVRNSVLGSILLKQNRKQQTHQCESFFLDIQQWKQQEHVHPSKKVLRFSTWWTTHEWIFKLALEITTLSDRASQLLYFHQ